MGRWVCSPQRVVGAGDEFPEEVHCTPARKREMKAGKGKVVSGGGDSVGQPGNGVEAKGCVAL